MLTENGRKYVENIGCSANSNPAGTNWLRTSGSYIDFYQYTVPTMRNYFGDSSVATPHEESPAGTESLWGKWIGIGTGDTAETANDYCLDNFVQLTYISGSATNTNGIVNITQTFQNDTQSSVTIKEVGLYLDMAGWTFLYARKVLDAPVTIPVGQSRAFTVHIDINS